MKCEYCSSEGTAVDTVYEIAGLCFGIAGDLHVLKVSPVVAMSIRDDSDSAGDGGFEVVLTFDDGTEHRGYADDMDQVQELQERIFSGRET